MNVAWNIEDADVERVCKLMDMMKDRPFVKNRQERNIVLEKLPKFSRDRFWYVMVACLLSTQQRSGPGSRLASFLKSTPFPLRLSECEREIKSLSDFVEAKASEHGLRRGKKVGDAGATNFRWFNDGGWDRVEEKFRELLGQRAGKPLPGDCNLERQAARFIDKELKGFGPKQSRNLWQYLGLSRFEIPLDSRMTKWFNRHILNRSSLQLSPTALADWNYYEFVEDGVLALCETAGILPCLVDAAIFSSDDLARDWSAEELEFIN